MIFLSVFAHPLSHTPSLGRPVRVLSHSLVTLCSIGGRWATYFSRIPSPVLSYSLTHHSPIVEADIDLRRVVPSCLQYSIHFSYVIFTSVVAIILTVITVCYSGKTFYALISFSAIRVDCAVATVVKLVDVRQPWLVSMVPA